MKKNHIVGPRRIILTMVIALGCISPVVALSDSITETITGCCKSVTECAQDALSIASDNLASEEDNYNYYPEDYDPIASGEIDPWDVYYGQQAEDMDRAMAEEAQRAWQEYNEPQPDISDRVIKP